MNRFNRNRGNTVTSKNYGRERNVHVFNFERVIGDSETHSGVDTREGKLLRLELQFKNANTLFGGNQRNSLFHRLRNVRNTQRQALFRPRKLA